MRFSIICTNYNKEPYIRKCIESVLEQSYTDFEFLIIDDCSVDNSPQIIQEYAEKYPDIITFIQNEKNQGMAVNYNELITISNGKLISLIDSDDFWFQDKLKVVDKYFNDNPNTVMHQHPLQIFNFNEPTKDLYRPFLLSGDILKYAQETKKIPLFVATTGLTFISEIVKKILPIPNEFSRNGEAYLTRTTMCYGFVGTTFKTLGGYRRTDTNIVFGNPLWDSFNYIENILKPYLNAFYKKNGFDLQFKPYAKPKNNIFDLSIRKVIQYIKQKIKPSK